eukprot:284815219_3
MMLLHHSFVLVDQLVDKELLVENLYSIDLNKLDYQFPFVRSNDRFEVRYFVELVLDCYRFLRNVHEKVSIVKQPLHVDIRLFLDIFVEHFENLFEIHSKLVVLFHLSNLYHRQQVHDCFLRFFRKYCVAVPCQCLMHAVYAQLCLQSDLRAAYFEDLSEQARRIYIYIDICEYVKKQFRSHIIIERIQSTTSKARKVAIYIYVCEITMTNILFLDFHHMLLCFLWAFCRDKMSNRAVIQDCFVNTLTRYRSIW